VSSVYVGASFLIHGTDRLRVVVDHTNSQIRKFSVTTKIVAVEPANPK
jgi:hypothetical protein